MRAAAALGVALVALTAAILVAPAGAHRRPTRSEASKIGQAAHASPLTRGVPCFHVRQIVVATGGRWASASLVPCKPAQTDTALGVFELRGRSWQLRDLGTSGVGCTVAPARVRRDLGLQCPA